MAERDQRVITSDLALEWATCPPATGSNWHHQRLSVVRGFAAHLHAIDAVHEVPPADLLPWRSRRAVPYLYTDAEILTLMDSARVIPTSHRAATMRTLIGLLAVTGMRVGEAIRLDRSDIDLSNGLLIVRDTEVRQVARGRASPQARSRLCGPISLAVTGPSTPRADRCGIHLGRRHQADLLQRSPRVQADRARTPDCTHGRSTAGHGRMTCATRSPSTRCSTPTAPARTQRPRCRCSRPTTSA